MKITKKRSVLIGIISVTIILFVLFYLINMSGYYFGYPRISENDRFCFTSWTVYHNTPLEHKGIEDHIRKEIAQLGSEYDVPWREIRIKQVNIDSITITVFGSWHFPSTPDHPNLQEKILQINGIDRIDEHVRSVCA